MKQFFRNFLYLMLGAIFLMACGSGASEVKEAEGDNPAYEVVEDKEELAKYYEIDFIKEWYGERVLPPQFDYGIDLTNKSYAELRLLRNEIFARNGYLFNDATLRGYFNQFKWYQPIFDVPEFKVQLNRQEQDFVNKVLALEKGMENELYVSVGNNKLLNAGHTVNLMQFEELDSKLMESFRLRNFAIVPASHEQLFYVYDQNQYEYIPNFYTTDVYLQLLHKHFGALLQDIEEKKLVGLMGELLTGLYNQSSKTLASNDEETKAAAEWANTYLAVALSALADGQLKVSPAMERYYEDELKKVNSASGGRSEFLDRMIFDYSQFTPRGNYTANDTLKQYFRCVKWLNTAPMNIGSEERFGAALLIAYWISKDEKLNKDYHAFNTVIGLFAGDEDNLSISHLIKVLKDNKVDDIKKLLSSRNIRSCKKELAKLRVDKINPVAGNDTADIDFAKKNILFTASRYSFDAETFTHLVHVRQPKALRPYPKGLDVFAALGNQTAEDILIDFYKENESWPAYQDSLNDVQQKFANYDGWDKGFYNKSVSVINSINKKRQDYPLFMQTSDWEKKNLNTTLSAWAELKHDLVLYAEQAMAAEAGQGGGPQPPEHVSYVEPNVEFWSGALDLLDYQEAELKGLGLLTEHVSGIIEDLKDMGSFFLKVSEKELKGENVSAKEFDRMTWMGGEMEYLCFRILENDHLPERDKEVAIITDVYTYNQMGKPGMLEVGVGLADEIYVIAEINGSPYLTKGACFSYREFISHKRRLTDEEWKAEVKKDNEVGRPGWMEDIYVRTKPLTTKPSFSF